MKSLYFTFILSSSSNKPNPAAINNNKGVVNGNSNGSSEPLTTPLGGKACESCNGKENIYTYFIS